jgi:hypothetical protein
MHSITGGVRKAIIYRLVAGSPPCDPCVPLLGRLHVQARRRLAAAPAGRNDGAHGRQPAAQCGLPRGHDMHGGACARDDAGSMSSRGGRQ